MQNVGGEVHAEDGVTRSGQPGRVRAFIARSSTRGRTFPDVAGKSSGDGREPRDEREVSTMTAKRKLTAVVAAGVLAVGGGLGGMVAFLSPYQGPDTAVTVPAAASGVSINGASSGSGTSSGNGGLTGININSLTGNNGGSKATTQGKQATQNNGGGQTTTQRTANGGG